MHLTFTHPYALRKLLARLFLVAIAFSHKHVVIGANTTAATTIDEAYRSLVDMGYNVSFVVADPLNNCSVLASSGTETTANPTASQFKFWVLGAMLTAINNGTLAWDQPIEIVEEHLSLPLKTINASAVGSTMTVRELANVMIRVSENTATDHLINVVGRSAVEQALLDYGHHEPELNIPFLYTRELTALKTYGRAADDMSNDPGPLGLAWIAANGDVTERLNILNGVDNITFDDLFGNLTWDVPIAVEDIEWFSSPLDFCRVISRLVEDEIMATILSQVPGAPDTEGLWSYIGFKGGNEVGLAGATWYVISLDGAHRVVSGTVWDPVKDIDNEIVQPTLGNIRDLSLTVGMNATNSSTVTNGVNTTNSSTITTGVNATNSSTATTGVNGTNNGTNSSTTTTNVNGTNSSSGKTSGADKESVKRMICLLGSFLIYFLSTFLLM